MKTAFKLLVKVLHKLIPSNTWVGASYTLPGPGHWWERHLICVKGGYSLDLLDDKFRLLGKRK